jgi:signal transduction histidine kinase
MQEKLLLVDDREDNLLSLETILEPEGYEFVRAHSGKEALKILLKELDFALILMDVRMPGLDGFETASLIYEREKLRHIPIIFITANDSGDENVYNGYKAGAVDFIHKPINPDLLRAKVSVFVDLHRKNERLRIQEKKLIAINKSLELEIRERKASEEKVTELNRQLMKNIAQLEAANKELDNFVFMASHDMQEPLRKIRTFANFLKTDYSHALDQPANNFIGRIYHSAERMQQLISDILSFSKISGADYSFTNTDLNSLMEEVRTEFSDTLQTNNGQILVDHLPSLPVNPGLIRSLFYNLIHNSIKYSKKDEAPTIRIYSKAGIGKNGSEKYATDYCSIIVEDNGIGFEQKYAEQIFDIFKRLHGTSEFGGTGIGLALCKKIVEKHHGYISARSKPKEGSTFIISLPCVQNGSKQEVTESSHSTESQKN